MISGLAQPDATSIGFGGQQGSGQQECHEGCEHTKLTHVSYPEIGRACCWIIRPTGWIAQTTIRPIKLSSIAARYRREEFDCKAAGGSACCIWIKHVPLAMSPSCPVYPR